MLHYSWLDTGLEQPEAMSSEYLVRLDDLREHLNSEPPVQMHVVQSGALAVLNSPCTVSTHACFELLQASFTATLVRMATVCVT